MLGRRTDLALEAKAIWEEGARGGELKGVRTRETEREGFAVTRVDILDEQGAGALGKPQGAYVTVELDTWSAGSRTPSAGRPVRWRRSCGPC